MERFKSYEYAAYILAGFLLLYALLAIGNLVQGVIAVVGLIFLVRMMYIEAALRELVSIEKTRLNRMDDPEASELE